jgi:hypothetical protein
MRTFALRSRALGAASQAADELWGDGPQHESVALTLDRDLGSNSEPHLVPKLSRDDDLALGAYLCESSLHGIRIPPYRQKATWEICDLTYWTVRLMSGAELRREQLYSRCPPQEAKQLRDENTKLRKLVVPLPFDLISFCTR